jgi:prepilin-type N-terminal cleavage/methylation domain-containing protein
MKKFNHVYDKNSKVVSNIKLFNGFTLAEVLITLGIIGVIAAITIPNLISQYKKEAQVTALKKFYSEFSQVLQRTKTDTGCSDSECMGFAGASYGCTARIIESNWKMDY